jgi:hypothetical protein
VQKLFLPFFLLLFCLACKSSHFDAIDDASFSVVGHYTGSAHLLHRQIDLTDTETISFQLDLTNTIGSEIFGTLHVPDLLPKFVEHNDSVRLHVIRFAGGSAQLTGASFPQQISYESAVQSHLTNPLSIIITKSDDVVNGGMSLQDTTYYLSLIGKR